MKQSEIIRLGVIAIALVFAYQGIMYIIAFIEFLITSMTVDGTLNGIMNLLWKLIAYFGTAYLLVRNSRRIALFIDEQRNTPAS